MINLSDRIRVLLILFLGVPGVSLLGFLVQRAEFAPKPPEFASMGRLASEDLDWVAHQLLSERVSNLAAERLEIQQPELKACVIAVVVQPADERLLNVVTSGSEPEYVQGFCNALMEQLISDQLDAEDRAPISRRIFVEDRASLAIRLPQPFALPVWRLWTREAKADNPEAMQE